MYGSHVQESEIIFLCGPCTLASWTGKHLVVAMSYAFGREDQIFAVQLANVGPLTHNAEAKYDIFLSS